jgi:hypothetical protein
MPHLWIESDDGDWHLVPLAADAHRLATGAAVESTAAAGDEALVHAFAGLWVLTGPESVRINGDALYGGVRVLRHADELRAGLRRVFYAEDEAPRVAPFPGADPPPRCPRCTRPIEAGAPAVQCRCGLWMHQSDEWPCFSHAPCPQCAEPTAIDDAVVWSPEGL